MRTKIRPNTTVDTFVCYRSNEDCVTILYNPNYINSLPTEQRKGVWIHELHHARAILTIIPMGEN